MYIAHYKYTDITTAEEYLCALRLNIPFIIITSVTTTTAITDKNRLLLTDKWKLL